MAYLVNINIFSRKKLSRLNNHVDSVIKIGVHPIDKTLGRNKRDMKST
jgi:hypothetical protein